MPIITCNLLYKCSNCQRIIKEPRSYIPPPGLPGTLQLDDYFEYKKITHECDEGIFGFCDIIGYKKKEKSI